jgi:hypothetical protein
MIIGLAVLFVVYKMIDGDIPPAFGILTIGLLLVTLYFCVWPPHELVPPIAIVSILVIMAIFPFVENYLNQVELRRLDADHLEKVLSAWQQRPENTPVAFVIRGSTTTRLTLPTRLSMPLQQELTRYPIGPFAISFERKKLPCEGGNKKS